MAIKANSRSPSASHPPRHHTTAQPPRTERRKQEGEARRGRGDHAARAAQDAGAGATSPPSSSPTSRRAPRRCDPASSRPQPPAAEPSTNHRHPRYVFDCHLCAPPSRALAPWPHAANSPKALPLHSPRPSRSHTLHTRAHAAHTHPGREQGPAFAEPPRELERERERAISADAP
ncbi:hypothetical protein BDA96_10G197800 [Sorghum bicolor]|uniref:Uncharacterized protein n=1 Tax=Sorghum bicolor TaxID=4558 RepID=A0A921Q637_SORBI|nr:hypothetical protein BDA96_10G197800 [Sorghum bicolor]